MRSHVNNKMEKGKILEKYLNRKIIKMTKWIQSPKDSYKILKQKV